MSMRLEVLLSNTKDISALVAQHLDAAALVRFGIASKDLRDCMLQSKILYACALRMFPGIRDFPMERNSHFYLKTFFWYFRTHVFDFTKSHFELVMLLDSIPHPGRRRQRR